jgi:hypothetical protein
MGEATKGQPGSKAAGEAESAPKRPRRKSKAALVSKVIEKIEQKLDSDQLKPTVGDFIRLLQLEKELKEEQPKEIKVSWVEPKEEEDASDT